jgi:hypothetical protein
MSLLCQRAADANSREWILPHRGGFWRLAGSVRNNRSNVLVDVQRMLHE